MFNKHCILTLNIIVLKKFLQNMASKTLISQKNVIRPDINHQKNTHYTNKSLAKV